MRRLVLGVMAAMTLAGCNVRDAFTAHPDEAARAGTLTLPAERLAKLLAGGKNVQLNRQTADFVANLWVDYALFAQAVARGDSLRDSVTVAAAMWPQLTELRAAHWHDSLMARRGGASAAALDSIYTSGDIRLLQHILVAPPPSERGQPTPEARAQARRTAEKVLAAAHGGENFASLASQASLDPGSRGDGGYLPPGPRGRFVPAFDSAGWALAPGAMSGLVETAYGYHIIRRPPLAEVRDRFEGFLRQQQAQQLDSLYLDSLAVGYDLKVSSTAPATMRSALEDPEKAAKSRKSIADYKGGALTQADFVRWIGALPPQLAGQLKTADDSNLVRFAKILSTNILLVRQADSAGITVTPVEWSGLSQRYQFDLDSLRAAMDLAASQFADGTASDAERARAAGLKVDAYFDDLVAGRKQLRPLPLTLGQVLRERGKWSISDAGLNRALELARGEKAKADSAAGNVPGRTMQPAPGPAPVPGGAAPGAAAPPAN
jgi:hypothetical protein